MIYITEDEPDINRLVRDALEAEGFRTRGFLRADEMLFVMQKALPDIVILDLMLPDADGLEVARQIKSSERTGHIPLIILTARTSEQDTLLGFDVGADDYVKKPFSPKELVARVKRFLRPRGPERLVYGPLTVIPEAHEALLEGERLMLSPGEFVLLEELVRAGGRTVRRSALLSAMSSDGGPRAVDVHIRNLRKKLGPHAGMIEAVRGQGYRLK